MRRYVETLRASPARADCRVMAPGDREWDVARARDRTGVILDPVTAAAFEDWAQKLGIPSVTRLGVE